MCLPTERPYDAFDDCAALQAEGLCSDEYLARKGCTKTCQQDLPAPNLIKFAEISCPHPPTPFDAINVSPVKTSYSVGDTITYQCNSSSEHVTSTCLTDGTWSPVGYVCGGCPSGWYVYNKVCHRRFVDEVKTFSEAKAVCASHGATLATAKSMEDVEFLFDLGDKDGDYIWLGLSKNSGGQWMWEDGTALSWSNWKSGNPSSGGCALMDSNKEWKSVSCSYDYIYVCSMQPSGRQACVDRREDCGDILRETPTLCQDQPDFAWLMCANTCGACTPTDPVASVAPSPSCPSDWTEYKNACYKFHDSWKTYADAGAACSAYGEGVTLTTAKDEGEFNFTKSIIVPLGESYWLGLDDLNQEGVFTWADGSPVIYSAWSRRQPDNKDTVNGVTTEADCTQVALNGLWKDISCDKKRRFICKSVLAGSSTNECVVPALPANANADPSIGSSLSRGQYVTYTCQDGYVPVSGDVRRACTENGVLTGTDLVCRAESEATTESSTVRLMDRQHVGDASYSYTGTAEHLRITRNGHVTAWRFYSNRAGQVAFQVFRPRPDLGSNSFELIGQNVVTTRENRVQTVAVDTADRIQVQDGDVLGIYCGQTVGGVPFENCQESQTQEGLSVMRSTVATSDPSTLTPGTVMEFDNSPTCRIFSFRAVIERDLNPYRTTRQCKKDSSGQSQELPTPTIAIIDKE
ncbi:hypothetical protein BaRGS_00000261 [Batillaria attramentaria]|uniref:Uncharacterized protein n=1 Tax=Batillaria attramentaria TaxID=370345 RepID=A0ABD0MBV9_9CAEN